MRIGIDASPVIHNYGGITNYTRNLLKGLLTLESGDEFFAYVAEETPRWRELEAWETSSRLKRVVVRRPLFRWRGWSDKLDLYHGTNFKVQTMGRLGTIVTIHDLWLDRYPEYSKKLVGQRLSFLRTRRRAHQADRVITVSEYSARDIEELYCIPKDRISVIPNGVSSDFRPGREEIRFSELQSQYGLPSGPYILFVGGADPRKNHVSLFRAYAQRPTLRQSHSLVIVGNPVHRLGNIMESARTFGLSDRVVCAGSVARDDLRLLYAHAALFVFPSRYEGFGFPVLEAMACGTPVITSNATALPEVAGNAALFVDPENAEELSEAMRRVLEDLALRATLTSRGLERARQFTWESTARQTLAVYRQVGS
ncbi:MAG: glycosyltransferase family 4 protein [Acidobacteriota bacterium]